MTNGAGEPTDPCPGRGEKGKREGDGPKNKTVTTMSLNFRETDSYQGKSRTNIF